MSRVHLKPGAPLLSVFTCVQAIIALVVAYKWINWGSNTFRLWPTAIFAILVFVGAVVRDISENRHVSTNMEGILFIPALFLLSPAELIVGRLIGGYFGSREMIGVSYKNWYNTAVQFLVIVSIEAAIDQIAPERSIATVTVEQAALVGFVVFVVYSALIPVWTVCFSLGRFGHVNRQVMSDGWSTHVVNVVEFALGTLVIMVLATSPWMFVPLLVIFGLILHMGSRSARHWILKAGMDHILDLTRSANRNSDPRETFSSVRRSVTKLGAVDEAVIAHIDDLDNVIFDPEPGPVVAAEVGSASRLRELAQNGLLSVSANGRRTGSLGVWRLSETTDDFLIAFCDRKVVRLRNFGQAVDIMSQHAALVHTTTSQRSALAQSASTAHKKARIDETTGRPNRLAAIEWLGDAVEREERIVVVAVRIRGLDDLQQILGEQAANEDLRAFVDQVLDDGCFDFTARVRDDIFVLIATGDVEAVIGAAQRVVSSDQHKGESIHAVAAGVVEVDTGVADGAENMLSDSLVALSRAERDGLKVARFDDRDAETARRRFAIGKALPEAIEQSQIYPVFQPQIAIESGELIGCEVLARWTHPELGFVSPVEFIEVAEQSNLIEPLTECMLAAACGARSRWIEAGIDVNLSVNISARSLFQPAFIEHIAALFARSGFRSDELTVEITESTIAQDDATTAESLELLHRIGATISIDDFGTGYSALAYLHRLPVDEVKIDKSMVMALGQERDPTDVVEGLIHICHRLGIRVVAEGVETSDALDHLAALRCDIAQGYFFAKPMNEEEWVVWAKDWILRGASAPTGANMAPMASPRNG